MAQRSSVFIDLIVCIRVFVLKLAVDVSCPGNRHGDLKW